MRSIHYSRFIVMVLILVNTCQIVYSQWSVVGIMPTGNSPFHPSDYEISGFTFINEDTGYYYYAIPMYSHYIEPRTEIKFTRNGGQNWWGSFTYSSFMSFRITSISFANPDTGYFIANNYVPDRIYRTTNNGNSWTELFYSLSGIGSLFALRGNLAYMTVGGNLCTYTDSLTPIYSFTDHYPSGSNAKFFYSLKGYLTTDYNGSSETFQSIIKTINGGYTWEFIYDTNQAPYFKISIPDDSTIYILRKNGTYSKTTNAGITWTDFNLPVTGIPLAISFCNANNGFILGQDNQLFRTCNGGNSWTYQNLPPDVWADKVFICSDSVAYVSGYQWNHNVLLKTVNGGFESAPAETIKPVFQAFPNPCHDKIRISVQENILPSDFQFINCSDLIGGSVLVSIQRLNKNEISIDLSSLKQGIYFITFRLDDCLRTLKVIRR